MKQILIIFTTLMLGLTLHGQVKPYDEQANAMEQISTAVAQAQAQQKYVICQVGGNWCPWCRRFSHLKDTCAEVRQIIEKNFVYVHINYSKENKNLDAMKRLGNPGRFGYPAFVILDGEGKVMHIQNSEYLEENKGYSVKKIVKFLTLWTPEAVNRIE